MRFILKGAVSFFFFLLHCYILQAENKIAFDCLSIDDGLSQSTVNCILQDRNGYMWFGTEDALNKYDGYNFAIYRSDLANGYSISDNFISALAEDSAGNLWVGTNNGVCRFDNSTQRFTTYLVDVEEPSISHNKINDIVVSSNNLIWIGTEGGGLNVYDPVINEFKVVELPLDSSQMESSNLVRVLTYHSRIGVVAVAANGKLYKVSDKSLETEEYTLKIGRKQVNINYAYISNDETIWVATKEYGLFKLDYKNNTFLPAKIARGYNLNKIEINEIAEDRYGNLWIATSGKGVFVYNIHSGILVSKLNNPMNNRSLSHDMALAVFIDNSDIVWIGTELGGLNKYDPYKTKFAHFSASLDSDFVLGHNMVYSMFEDSKANHVYIGTYRGWVNKINFDDGTIEYLRIYPLNRNEVEVNTVYAIDQTYNGDILIGSKKGGLHIYDPKNEKLTSFDVDNNEFDVYMQAGVRAIETDAFGNIWIGTMGKGLVKYNVEEKEFESFDCMPAFNKGVAHNTIYDLMLDENDMLWIGTDGGGLKMLNPATGQIDHYLFDEADTTSLSNNYIANIYEDEYNNIWVGTLGGGLNKFVRNQKRFIALDRHDGLADIIYGILPGGKNELWLSSTIGLLKYDTRKHQIKKYTVEDGLQSNEFNGGACLKTKSKKLIFGGINGVNAFFADEVFDNQYVPKVIFTDILIDHKNVVVGDENNFEKHISESEAIELSYKQDVVSISFSAMHFSCPKRIEYAYKLEGFDDDWHYIGNKNLATFTNLDPGKYTLLVKATNSDGVWNDNPAKLKITIEPPFWETRLFMLAQVFLALVLISTIIVLRERRLRRRKLILEKLVAKRTEEISKQKEEIESQRDEIAAQRDEITTQKENLELYNNELVKQKLEIENQRDEIEMHRNKIRQRNKNITDSILYAEKIQSVILPSEGKIKSLFPDSFVYFKPKDIVSGDFYWFEEKGNKKYFSAVDCTGHGVPGALMSIVCHNMLNEAINQYNLEKPSDILKYLSENVSANFRSTGNYSDLKDGMDLALCVYDPDEMVLEYAGAFNPLYIIRNGNLLMFHPECHSINVFNENKKDFTNHRIQLNEDDLLYLFTDGYVDQFGGDDRKKFLKRRFKETLKTIHKLPLGNQKENLSSIFENWKKDYEQIDDVLVMGIKISKN